MRRHARVGRFADMHPATKREMVLTPWDTRGRSSFNPHPSSANQTHSISAKAVTTPTTFSNSLDIRLLVKAGLSLGGEN
jgi:hypothetical protein